MKIYAVRKGKQTGKFLTWDECKSYTQGFSGAEYKSFSGVNAGKDADNYLNFNDTNDVKFTTGKNQAVQGGTNYTNPYGCTGDCGIAFVDGSWDKVTKTYSFGCIIFTETGKYVFCGCDDDSNYSSSANVAGEVLGALTAVRKAYDLGLKHLMLVHDYNGIHEWVHEERPWTARALVSQSYQHIMNKYRKLVDVKFVRVDSHTGVTHNEEVDLLAKRAIKEHIKCRTNDIFIECNTYVQEILNKQYLVKKQ